MSMKAHLHAWLCALIDHAICAEGIATRPHIHNRTSTKDICWSVVQKGSGEVNAWNAPETFCGEIRLSFWGLPSYGNRCESLANEVVSMLTAGSHGLEVAEGLFSVAFALTKQGNLETNTNTVLPKLYAADFWVRCAFYSEGVMA